MIEEHELKMIIPIWKNPMLSLDDRYEVALGEIERLNKILGKARVLAMRVDTLLEFDDD
jgi:hypothetical protein